jgi:protein O-mannosyl-transferase
MTAPLAPPPRIRIHAAAAIIVLAALAAWYNSLSAPFIFDDEAVVKENPTIRHLWPLGTVLSPPATGGGSGVLGRPVVNLSLAINYALGGLDVRGYHLLNVVIHLLAALTLFGIVRRTLLRFAPPPPGRAPADGREAVPALRAHALPVAFAAALLWTLHPLVTESVTCVVQRTETLVSLFYLLTLYCFVRGVGETPGAPPPAPRAAGPTDPVVRGRWARGPVVWFSLSFLSCLVGMATKEVMVTAPLVILLYDRAFVAGTFGGAWRRRRGLYLGYAATWILLGYLVLFSGGERAGAAGFGLGVSPWSYALTQCRAITHYLRLAVWPHPLVVDYGFALAHSVADVWWRGLLVLGLLGATIWALVRRPRAGLLGASFFLILAPSSSVLPLITQTVAEHRMYLPLAAVVTAGVLAAYRCLGRAGVAALLLLAPAFGWLTRLRNADYRTAISIWTDTVAKLPSNPRAHGNLGNALLAAGRYADAVAQYQEALQLKPDYNQLYNNLGDALLQLHRPREAVAALAAGLRLFPSDPNVHNNLGAAFLQLGRTDDAIREYEAALSVEPGSAATESNLALALSEAGRADEAIAHYQAAVRLQPDLATAHFALGNLLARAGRFAEAVAEYRQVVQLEPGNVRARTNLGNALLLTGRVDEAIAAYREVLRQHPDDASARANLARALAMRAAGSPGP